MTTDRRGFALLVSLWLVVAIAAILAVALSEERLNSQAARNRLALARAAWARDACVAILQAHYKYADPLHGVDSVDLGRRTWCTAIVSDPSKRLNVNRASREQLRTLFSSDSIADAIVDWRDADDVPRARGAEAGYYHAMGRPSPANQAFGGIGEVKLVRGLEAASLDRLRDLLTIAGDGTVNVASADPAVVSTLPGLEPGDAIALRQAATSGARPQSLDELIGQLGERRREELMPWLQELRAAVSFRPAQVVVEVTGASGDIPVRARATLTAVPLPERIAVVRRVLW